MVVVAAISIGAYSSGRIRGNSSCCRCSRSPSKKNGSSNKSKNMKSSFRVITAVVFGDGDCGSSPSISTFGYC